ncbi:NAD(P)H-binding protein [Streptomyces sp. NBC_01476]|uniref:NAD(P)H-binding protein n=1 Tax=Streptomyces sp. NBC_01476 TaxID=2903881 RepID=UPI002E32E607|nr:NAD(P)H-binding protein [Streptomyces sp. NBC_01476]
MKVIVFGGSGMVGQGVLRACLLDPGVTEVVAVVRRPLKRSAEKLREVLHDDFTDFSAVAGELTGADACFYCLGVSSAGRAEAEYQRLTYDYALAAARAVTAGSPELTFTYVSGEGTDSSERGRSAWARIKGRTENALLSMDMRAYMFRPGWIQPVNGETSRTRWYRVLYALTSWLYPVLRRVVPRHVTTTDRLGRAMLAVVRLDGGGPHILHSPDINRLGA